MSDAILPLPAKFPMTTALDLQDDVFLRELHHLLWIDPFENQGTFDTGWSCRDHAFIVGCLLGCVGKKVRLTHGKNMFIQGPDAGRPPVGIGQESTAAGLHTWLKSDAGKIIDLSPRLDLDIPPLWRGTAFTGIVDGQLFPRGHGEVRAFTTRFRYDQSIAEATHRQCTTTALYLEQAKTALSPAVVKEAVDFINSPLTDRLRQLEDIEIYPKCVLHLLGFVGGSYQSLAHLPQHEAWAFLSEEMSEATDQLLRLMWPGG